MLNLKSTQKNKRLDHYLSEKLLYSRTQLQAMIKLGKVLVNGCVAKSSYLVCLDDFIEIDQSNTTMLKEVSDEVSRSLDLLYEDDHLLVLNKPVGLVVHPNDVQQSGTLTDVLLQYVPSIKGVGQIDRPGIVHRLDKDTSGVMVIAKTVVSYEHLFEQFKSRYVKKRYIAVVSGNIQNDHFTIDQPLLRHSKKRHLQVVSKEGKEAITEVIVLKRFNTKTLIEARPLSGRTHQIRVHLQYIGHPILGDPLYGKKKKGEGQYLQAFSLSFEHPITRKQLFFSVPCLFI